MFSFTITSAQAITISRYLRRGRENTSILQSNAAVQFRSHSWVQVPSPLAADGEGERTVHTRKFSQALARVASTRICDMDSPVTVTIDTSDPASVFGTFTGPAGTIDEVELTTSGVIHQTLKEIPDSYPIAPAEREIIWRIAQVCKVTMPFMALDNGYIISGDIFTANRFIVARGHVTLPKELEELSRVYLGVFKLIKNYRHALSQTDIAFTKDGWLVFNGMVFPHNEYTARSLADKTHKSLARFTRVTGTIQGACVLPQAIHSLPADTVGGVSTLAVAAPFEDYPMANLYISREVLSEVARVIDSRVVFEKNTETAIQGIMPSTGTLTGTAPITVIVTSA